jgi:hypothetical protein
MLPRTLGHYISQKPKTHGICLDRGQLSAISDNNYHEIVIKLSMFIFIVYPVVYLFDRYGGILNSYSYQVLI